MGALDVPGITKARADTLYAPIGATGDLPEAAAYDAPRTTAATATALTGKLTRFRGTITQPMPPAVAGRAVAIGVETTGLVLNADGSDIFVDDTGATSTTLTPPTPGVRTLRCTTAGQWRTTTGHLPVSVLDGRYPLKTQVATLEELFFTKDFLASGLAVNASGSAGLFVAPIPLKIVAASFLMWNGSTLAADDTNYWTFYLRKGTSTQVAAKTTKTTGGQAFPSRGDWNFDAVTFDATASNFAKGDILTCYIVPTGTPANAISGPMNITVRYVPL